MNVEEREREREREREKEKEGVRRGEVSVIDLPHAITQGFDDLFRLH